MRTSLTEIAVTENYLQGKLAPEDALFFEARAIINPALADDISAQKQSYLLITQYGRKQLKAELETIHHKLFAQPQRISFAQRIRNLFGR